MTRPAAAPTISNSPSTCHIASLVCSATLRNPSSAATCLRSSRSRVPFTQPAPPGLASAHAMASFSRLPPRSTGNAKDSR